MTNNEFLHWFSCYQEQALMLKERRLVVLVGRSQWASDLLKAIDKHSCDGASQTLATWLIYGESNDISANVSKQRFRDKLGTESHFVVFQDTQLSIDALAGLSGTLVAGGMLFLLVNDLSDIKDSLFFQRFLRLISAYSVHAIIKENAGKVPALPSITHKSDTHGVLSTFKYQCVTQEQLSAVEAVINVVKGRRNCPLVLTADRGRGKSSALAIACGRLFELANEKNKLRIVITSGDLSSLAVFFSQLQVSHPQGKLQKGKFTTASGLVEFIPIDQLLQSSEKASLVLVDEAAAIPVYLLEQLLDNYSRLVFSSTIHGYEGAGRGFTLKFQQSLKSHFPKYRSFHLNEPIRWRQNDPLEKIIFEACLLNAELPRLLTKTILTDSKSFQFKAFMANELAADDALLSQVFAVLVTAHYQTKPSDLKMLLDNKNIRLLCLFSEGSSGQQVVAVALLINEGSFGGNIFDADKISAVNHSERRLKNNFIPQSLLTQCSIEQAFNYHYLRVMRIAVHPQVQQQGIGRYFMEHITHYARSQGADFLASSFGATKRLLSFWLTNDFKLARIGFKKDKASGEQSALVLKALSNKSKPLLDEVNHEFYRSFDYLLTDEYQDLPDELVALILSNQSSSQCLPLTERDKATIEGFGQGHKQYANCVFSLHLWLKLQLAISSTIDKDASLVFISRIMQKNSIEQVCIRYGFTGKKELEQFLRSKVLLALAG